MRNIQNVDDEILLKAEWLKERAVIVSTERTYVLDLALVERPELRAAGEVLKRMNFDRAFDPGFGKPDA